MKLLHLDASIQTDLSVSRPVSAALVNRIATLEPSVEIIHHDLAASPLPHVTLPSLGSDQSATLVHLSEASG